MMGMPDYDQLAAYYLANKRTCEAWSSEMRRIEFFKGSVDHRLYEILMAHFEASRECQQYMSMHYLAIAFAMGYGEPELREYIIPRVVSRILE